jgi:hypothetical protein
MGGAGLFRESLTWGTPPLLCRQVHPGQSTRVGELSFLRGFLI